jgi:hypothetical protein
VREVLDTGRSAERIEHERRVVRPWLAAVYVLQHHDDPVVLLDGHEQAWRGHRHGKVSDDGSLPPVQLVGADVA